MKIITSEFVSYGHPDKIADIIADRILDGHLVGDKNTRAGIEVMCKDSTVVLGGEISSRVHINYDEAVKEVFSKLNFPSNHNLSPKDIKVINLIGKQSKEIHKGVEKDDIGAGDQGIVFGFASNETEFCMPLGYQIAKDICQTLVTIDNIGPDIKSQVSISYDNEIPQITDVLVSSMHQIEVDEARLVIKNVINELLSKRYSKNYSELTKIDINPCGSWKIGGPVSDCGVTGRKLVVDNYGGYCQIGGGNMSGKDLSKVDRSGAYMARYLAKNIVVSGLASTAKIGLSYVISKPNPSNLEIELTDGKVNVNELKEWICKNVNLTVGGMIDKFSYKKFANTSIHGHFGNNTYPWEQTDIAINMSEFFTKK